jgi:hypothetical protein
MMVENGEIIFGIVEKKTVGHLRVVWYMSSSAKKGLMRLGYAQFSS